MSVNTLPQDGPTVLVVEDEWLLRMDAVDTLEEAGFLAVEAEDVRGALTLLRSTPGICAVVTDVELAGRESGFDLARQIRAEFPLLPVLVVSGRLRPAAPDALAGARFMPKPYRPAAMVRTVSDMVALHAA